MSKTPSPVLSAVTTGPRLVTDGEYIYPVTLAAYAILEAIGSPLLTGGSTPTRWVPTLYLMTRPIRDVLPLYRDGSLETAALEWAVDIPVSAFRLLVDAAVSEIETALKAAEGMGGNEKGADFPSATAGSSKSPNAPAAPTAGAGTPSATPCP